MRSSIMPREATMLSRGEARTKTKKKKKKKRRRRRKKTSETTDVDVRPEAQLHNHLHRIAPADTTKQASAKRFRDDASRGN